MAVKPKRNITYTQITREPTAKTIAELFSELLALTGLTPQQYSELTNDLADEYPISESSLKSWLYRGVLPSKSTRKTVLSMFENLCDKSQAEAWINKFLDLLLNAKEPKKINDETDTNIESTDDQDYSSEESTVVGKTTQENLDNKLLRREQERPIFVNYYILSLVIIGVMLVMLTLVTLFVDDNITVVNEVSVDNRHAEISAVNANDKYSYDNSGYSLDNIGYRIGLSSESPSTRYSKIKADYQLENSSQLLANIKPGLTMDVYSWSSRVKELPSIPVGNKLATLPFTKNSVFTFSDYAVDKETYEMAADTNVGLFYNGLVHLSRGGNSLIYLNYNSGYHVINQVFKKCRLVLVIENNTVFDRLVPVGNGQTVRLSNQVNITGGINKFGFWFSCHNLRSFNSQQDYKAFKDTRVRIYIKSPGENKLSLIDNGNMFH